MTHPLHPTRNNWHTECDACYVQICDSCGHLRCFHSHQGQCLAPATPDCRCDERKGRAAFHDPFPHEIPEVERIARYYERVERGLRVVR